MFLMQHLVLLFVQIVKMYSHWFASAPNGVFKKPCVATALFIMQRQNAPKIRPGATVQFKFGT